MIAPQSEGDLCHSHGHAGVAGISGLYGVHRQGANSVRHIALLHSVEGSGWHGSSHEDRRGLEGVRRHPESVELSLIAGDFSIARRR